jgi:hypothetical protein
MLTCADRGLLSPPPILDRRIIDKTGNATTAPKSRFVEVVLVKKLFW